MRIGIANVHMDLGSGRRGTDMGPSAMHVAGVIPGLLRLGHEVHRVTSFAAAALEELEAGDPQARFLPEIAEVCARLADHVEAEMASGAFPLVLGGDHAQAIGTVSGMARHLRRTGGRLGVLWIDAHADMNTPETSPTGNVHGMPLAVLLGDGPKELVALSGSEPALRPEDVAIIGAREIDPDEVERVRAIGVRVYTMSELDTRGTAVCVGEAIARVTAKTAGLHLSFDIDGVDPADAPGVGTPAPGGLSLRESHLICEAANASGKLLGMEMVEINPTMDVRNQTGKLAVWLVLSALGKTIL